MLIGTCCLGADCELVKGALELERRGDTWLIIFIYLWPAVIIANMLLLLSVGLSQFALSVLYQVLS